MLDRNKALLALLLLSAVLLVNRWCGTEPANPQSLEEVRALADKLGLNCRSDRQDGTIGFRLLVSETPLTQEQANLLCIGRREKGRADWHGVVAAYSNLDFDADLMVPWGKVLLYGDPALIEKLTGSQSGPVS
jgi:hypothetical protein